MAGAEARQEGKENMQQEDIKNTSKHCGSTIPTNVAEIRHIFHFSLAGQIGPLTTLCLMSAVYAMIFCNVQVFLILFALSYIHVSLTLSVPCV